LRVSAGNHRLVFRFVPDLAWKILRVISLLSLFCWLFIEIVFSVLRSAY
jgi:hypothetical protein